MKRVFSYLVIFWATNLVAFAQLSIWSDAVTSDGAIVLDTTERFVSTALSFNFGSIPGEGTYEFIVNATDNGASMVIANTGNQALKFEQYSNTGRIGFTVFGGGDYLFTPTSTGSDASPFGVTSMLTFVVETTGTTLYVNGALAGTSSVSITALSGTGALGGAGTIGSSFDDMNATFYGVATFDSALTAQQISDHYTAFAGSAVPEPSTWGLLVGVAALVLVGAKRIGLKRARQPENSGGNESLVQDS